MPQPEFIIFELLTILVFAACLWHAARQGKARVLELFASLVFGVTLEWMTLKQLEAYHYGQFLIMIDGAPLCIGLGWAVIIYSGMECVRQLDMPVFARPFLVGLMALNIDLAMDAVAIRLGFWNWVIPLDMQWYGVPYGNFWSWFIVASSFSGMVYWLRARGWHNSKQTWRLWTYPVIALFGSILILAATNFLFVNLFAHSDIGSTMAMVVLVYSGIVVVYVSRPRFIPTPRPDWVVLSVPLVFHLFFTIVGFLSGIYMRLTVLAVVGLLMFLLGLGIHLWPWFTHFVDRRQSGQK